MNLTAGCAHNCAYCYTQGYLVHPGAGRVEYYANAYEQLVHELPRKRKRPKAVYFSPSSDLFQPIPEVLELGFKIIRFLLNENVGVAFLTKGRIPPEHMKLLLSHPDLVRAQIGVISLDDRLLEALEPGAPPAGVRLEQAARLIAGGIPTTFRLDPIFPDLTDREADLESLCRSIAATGVDEIAASTLFLRPGLGEMLRRRLAGTDLVEPLFAALSRTERLRIHAENSTVLALPANRRRAIYERLRTAALTHGLSVLICGCKNPDLTATTCNISGTWDAGSPPIEQKRLFPLD